MGHLSLNGAELLMRAGVIRVRDQGEKMRAGSDNVERLPQIVHQGGQQIFRLGIVKWTHDVAQRICQVYRERAAGGIVFSDFFLLVMFPRRQWLSIHRGGAETRRKTRRIQIPKSFQNIFLRAFLRDSASPR